KLRHLPLLCCDSIRCHQHDLAIGASPSEVREAGGATALQTQAMLRLHKKSSRILCNRGLFRSVVRSLDFRCAGNTASAIRLSASGENQRLKRLLAEAAKVTNFGRKRQHIDVPMSATLR